MPSFRLVPIAALAAMLVLGVASAAPQPRNVIFLLGDGMGFAQVKAYRAYADNPLTQGIEPLPFDRYLSGAVATDGIAMNCPSGPASCEPDPYAVIDSAAAATAYATGIDTMNGAIGVDPAGKPVETVLEVAAKQGMGTGLVVTSQLTHASPAAFAAHVPSRRMSGRIADQLFDNMHDGMPMVQVLLGGGMEDFRRGDRDVLGEFREAGYAVATDLDGFEKLSGTRIIGVFADGGLPRRWDRTDRIPTLSAMVGKALETLDKNEEGFFLMVEGSQIDWAGHGDDILGVISEMEGFAAAAQVILDFAAGRDDTLVVITADHETGGLSLARDGDYRWDPTSLRGVKRTSVGILEAFAASSGSGKTPAELLSAVVAVHVPFELTPTEKTALDSTPLEERALYAAINRLFDERTRTGWSTLGHTGVDVPLYSMGPGSEAFSGVLQNEEVGKALLRAVRRSEVSH